MMEKAKYNIAGGQMYSTIIVQRFNKEKKYI
jgi:hypothetical protein